MTIHINPNSLPAAIDEVLKSHGLQDTVRLLAEGCKRAGKKAKQSPNPELNGFWEENYRRLLWFSSRLS